MNRVVSAHLDKRTGRKVFCGYPRCHGQLGILMGGFPNADEEMVLLMPYFRANVGPQGRVTWRSFRRAIKNFAYELPGVRRSQKPTVLSAAPLEPLAKGKGVRLTDPPYPYRGYRPVDLPAVVVCPECRAPNRVAWELLLPPEEA